MSKIVKTVLTIAVAVAVIVFAPQIAAVLASVAGSVGVTVTAAALTSALVGMGLSLALTAAMSVFRKAPSMSQSLVDRLNTSVVPTAARKIIFGTTAGGQDVRFFESDFDLKDTKKDGYVQVIALASHRITAFKQFYVENDLVWSGGTWLKKRDGFAPQNPLRIVTEGKPGNGFAVGSGSYWRSTASFTGCAYFVPTWKLDSDIWESGIPQRLTAVVDGCPVYDPRRDSTRGGSGSHRYDNQDTWAFADGAATLGRNPALALLTYLIGWRINGKVVWGMGLPANRIDLDNFRAYANVCEEGVATAAGGTVQRYTHDGIYSTSDSHDTVINAITAAMGSCKLTDRGGTYCLVGGYDDTAGPKVEFTADDLVAPANGSSPYIWNPAPASRERFNIVRGRFANPEELFQLTDWGDPIEQPALADGIPRTLTLDLGGVSRAETCQRIAKQFLLREYLTPGMFSATFGPKAFAVEVGSVITLSLPSEGWNSKLFRVMEQAESHDMFFTMTLREEDPAIYAWDREEKPLAASIRPQGYDASLTIAPEGLALNSASYAGANGINVSEVHVTWTPENSGRVTGIQIQSRPQGSEAWTEQAAIFDPKAGTFTFTSNAPGITVEVRARYRMMSAVYSAWVQASIGTAPVQINYDDVDGTPGNLADINPDEGGKLDGIQPGATVGGTIGSNIKNPDGSIYVPPSAGQLVDTVAPAVPSGLTLTSTLTDAGATLKAIWNGVSDSDLAGYVIAIKEAGGNYIEFVTGLVASYERTAMPRNTAYTAKVLAYDKAGNRSGFSAEVTYTTAKDSTPPAPPTNVRVEATYDSAFVTWANPADPDLACVVADLVDLTHNPLATIVVAGVPSGIGQAIFTGLNRAWPYAVRVRSADTSGNNSELVYSDNFTTAGGIAASDFAPDVSPIKTVPTLPAAAGYTGPTTVLNQADGRLYNYVSGAWVAATDTTIPANSIGSDKLAVTLGGGNLIRNSSFDNLPYQTGLGLIAAGYANYNNNTGDGDGTTWDVQVNGRRGGYSQLISWSKNTGTKGVYLTNVAGVDNANIMKPYSTYVLTIYAKGAGSALQADIGLRWNTAPTVYPRNPVPLTTEWQRYEFKLITGANVDPSIYVTSNYSGPDAGYMYLDDIQLEEGDVATAYAASLLPGEVTTTMLAPGAVSMEKLVDGAVNGTKIAENSVDTGHIKAGAITTSLLRVGSMTELNPDPGFRDTTFWENNGIYNGRLGTSAGSVPGWYNSHGDDINDAVGTSSYCMLWDAYFNSDGRQHLISTVRGGIKAGTTYQFSALGRNASNQTITVLCRMHDTRGTFLSDAAMAWGPGQGLSNQTMQFVAPATATNYHFYVYNSAGVAFSGNAEMADLQVREVSGSTMIANGAITTEKITVNSLDGDRIRAGSLNADRLIANTINVGKLAVQTRPVSVVGVKLQVGADGVVSWTNGQIIFPDASGNYITRNVVAGGIGWNPAWIYPVNICFDSNSDNVGFGVYYSQDLTAYSSQLPLAIWSGGTDLVMRAGTSTVVNGNNIITGTVNGDRIITGTLNADKITAGTVGAAQIAAGAIVATKLAIGNTDNIVPDGEVRDPTWWNSGVPDGRLVGEDSAFTRFRRVLAVRPNGGIDVFSNFFQVEPGATYKITLGIDTTDGFNGYIQPIIHLPGYMWFSPVSHGNAGDPTQFPAACTLGPGVSNYYETTLTNWPNVDQRQWQFRIMGSWTGTARLAYSIVRVSDTTLIADGAITTDKITVGTLNGDRLAANSVNAGALMAGTVMSNTITVNGTTIGNVQAQAANSTPLTFTQYQGIYTINGNLATKTGGGDQWDYNAWVDLPQRGSFILSGKFPSASTFIGVHQGQGYQTYGGFEYAWHRSANGLWYIFENGNVAFADTVGGGVVFNEATVFRIEYLGNVVNYYADAGLVRSIGCAPNLTFNAGFAIATPGSSVRFLNWTSGNDNSLANTDPAARVNAYTTTINPGKILIQGSTTLDSWRDQTSIRGGAIATNSVSAEKIAINARGVTALGLDFRYEAGRLWWSDGHVLYTDDYGNPASPHIDAGSIAWGGGSYNYIVWDKGASYFRQTVDGWESSQTANANSIIMVTWRNGSNFVANYGGTIVSGDRIVTNSITATQIAAGAVTADKLSVGSLSAITANIGLLRTAASGQRMELDSNSLRAYDANGTLRVRVGIW